MRAFPFRSIVCAAIIALSPSANAVFIVDTGPGAGGQPGGPSLFSGQDLAGEFTIAQSWLINSVEGWIAGSDVGETATVAIFTDGGAVPGSELFSASFSSTGDRDAAWEGASGLGWLLAAGTYWVTFELRAGQTMDAYMPTGAPNPLALTAWAPGGNGAWTSNNNSFPGSIGVRIDAQAAVPEPATLALLGVGLAGFAATRRRRRA